MGDAVGEPERNYRFFCHRCTVEYEDDYQNDTCIYCGMGFIEQIENNARTAIQNRDSEMNSLDYAGGGHDDSEPEEIEISSNSHVDEAAALPNNLSRRERHARLGLVRPPRAETLMEHLVWILGAGREGAGVVTAGTPFVLVGALGDYVFGGEGLDTVVTQLLGQIDNAGPPPLPTEQISTIPSELITAAQVEANLACSVCWDAFTLDESVSRLECAHFYHQACINPWLQQHATCPICRHSLLPATADTPEPDTRDTPEPNTRDTPEPDTRDTAETDTRDTAETDTRDTPEPDTQDTPEPATRDTPAPQTAGSPESQPVEFGTNTATSPMTMRTGIAPAAASSSSNGGPGLSRLWAQVSASINMLANLDSPLSDTSRFIDFDFD